MLEPILITHPQALKDATASQVSTHNYTDFTKLTRQCKLLIHTQGAETVIQIFQISIQRVCDRLLSNGVYLYTFFIKQH